MATFDAQKFVGKWQLSESENFDAYLKAANVGFLARTAAKTIKSSLEFIVDGNHWKMISTSTFKTTTLEFDIGQEFEHETIDGRKMKSTFSIDNNKLVQLEKHTKSDDKDSRLERYVDDDKLIIDLECDGIKAKRVYTRA
uniref:Cytosolic fatty-acid binding proteins domain-containing protein n=1 Tax=Acrobeloides nanus TaxID=290746 RepID=A0A914EF49_9BILA